jgi:hypothetical protein
LVTGYHNNGEILSFMQDGGKYGVVELVAALPTTSSLGLGAKLKLAQTLMDMPAAVGTRYELDSVMPSSWDGARFNFGDTMGLTDRLGTAHQIDLRTNLHLMTSFMNSLYKTYQTSTWDNFPGVRH